MPTMTDSDEIRQLVDQDVVWINIALKTKIGVVYG